MMYKFLNVVDDLSGESVQHIFRDLTDGGMQSFPNVESNDSPERMFYLDWLAEGNEPEPLNSN